MSRLMWSLRGRGLLVAVALLGSTTALEAQNRRTVLTVTGLPLTVTGITNVQYDAGSVTVGTVSFSVNLTTNSGGGFTTRVTTVQVRCGACTGNFARYQWRRNDLGVWNVLSTTYTTIESRTAVYSGSNDPWSNSIHFRYMLAYATVAPQAATQHRLQFQLVVTAP